MGTKGVGCVGQITKNCNVDKLSMAECDLKHEELDSFMKHSDGAKVRNFRLRVIMRCPGCWPSCDLLFCWIFAFFMFKKDFNFRKVRSISFSKAK